MIRAVIDANPLVASFINSRGYPARIISAWKNGEFQIIVSPSILKEYERVFFFPEILKKRRRKDDNLDALR
jgi:predicted nucleic acid-binding protein